MNSTFRSLASYNYRVWASGAIVSNVGTWMQRTAQDWLVLTQLTHNNATAVGIVMALQFGPQLLMFPITGAVVDRFPRRRILATTQAAMGLLALLLGILTVTHLVVLWHVYVFALLLGVAAAFDAPARQVFVNELVTGRNLSNAVALNATSFNIARMIGPAIAGVLIALIGTGWVFLANCLTFAGVLLSLYFIRASELHVRRRNTQERVRLADGFSYIWRNAEIRSTMIVVFLIGTFGLNFPIFISTMNVSIFHANSAAYGLLTTILAVGSVVGALIAARRERPRLAVICLGAGLFALGCGLAAIMPSYWLFGIMLVLVGVAAQTITTSANSLVQLSTPPEMRGRVMAIYLAVFLGGTPIGAPLVGFVADTLGPRWGLAVGAASGLASAGVLLWYLVTRRHLRVSFHERRPHMQMDPTVSIQLPFTEPVPQLARATAQKTPAGSA